MDFLTVIMLGVLAIIVIYLIVEVKRLSALAKKQEGNDVLSSIKSDMVKQSADDKLWLSEQFSAKLAAMQQGVMDVNQSNMEKTNELHKEIIAANNQLSQSQAAGNEKFQKALQDALEAFRGVSDSKLEQINASINERLEKANTGFTEAFNKTDSLHKEIIQSIGDIGQTNKEAQLALAKSLSDSLAEIRQMNEKKLDEINRSVSEKLDTSLNERLDSSFKQIGEQLGNLYESLGELSKMSGGISDLNRALANVKTRGIWGEMQLRGILENTMVPAQYEENVATKKNSQDRVEFVIKIPSKSDDEKPVLLPIDSKFPTDLYNKIITASEAGDVTGIQKAKKELEDRIKTEARTIRDKYINPPVTTDFAIMFIPTESMYAEILRIDGLNEWCQNNCKIIISGPTTITALLNSLRVGFSNLTLNKKTQEVIKVLQAVKTQYLNLDELIEKTQKKLSEAVSSTDNLKKRTDIIQKRMSKIDAISMEDAEKILSVED